MKNVSDLVQGISSNLSWTGVTPLLNSDRLSLFYE